MLSLLNSFYTHQREHELPSRTTPIKNSPTSENFLWSPFNLTGSTMPAMMRADGWKVSPTKAAFFCSSFASAVSLVFRCDLSAVDSAQRLPADDRGHLSNGAVCFFAFSFQDNLSSSFAIDFPFKLRVESMSSTFFKVVKSDRRRICLS